jgi:hypothetical protein
MSKVKKVLPTPKSPPHDQRQVWTYFVSRDSLDGVPSAMCNLWYAKPMRTKVLHRVVWLAGDDDNPCHLGEYSLDDVRAWFRTIPDTDLELIKIDQFVTERMLAESKAQARGKQ